MQTRKTPNTDTYHAVIVNLQTTLLVSLRVQKVGTLQWHSAVPSGEKYIFLKKMSPLVFLI